MTEQVTWRRDAELARIVTPRRSVPGRSVRGFPPVKTCHICHAEFPSGLTCPECRAFVVDLPDEDDRPVPDPGSDSVPAPGSLGGWVIPEVSAAGPPAHEVPTSSSRALAEPEPGSLGGWVAPARRDDWSDAPPLSPPTPPRSRVTPPPFSVPAVPDPTTNGRTEPPRDDAGSRARAANDLRPAGLAPKWIVLGIAAVVAVLVIGVVALRPKPADDTRAGASTGSPSDVTGTCIRYTADRTMLDRTVPCTDDHQGTVVAYVTEQTSCPPVTDSILTTKADLAGTAGVLCIDDDA